MNRPGLILKFLSIADAERVSRTFRKLARHDVRSWILTGGIAIEIHGLVRGFDCPARGLNDLDFIVGAFDRIPETLAEDLLARHIHPSALPGKTMMQLVDPDAALRLDVFRGDGETMSRAVSVELPSGPIRIVSLEDLVARAARLLPDLEQGAPVASKHARDYFRFVELADSAVVEIAWQDHRKPMHPATFRVVHALIRDLISARSNLLITPEYSTNPGAVCPLCVPAGAFQLADPNVVLSILGYC
jgi:hypothetical protein